MEVPEPTQDGFGLPVRDRGWPQGHARFRFLVGRRLGLRKCDRDDEDSDGDMHGGTSNVAG